MPRSLDIERFFDLSLDMLCIAGVDGFFKRINAAFEKILGWKTEQLLGRPFIEFVHPGDVESTLAEITKLASGLPTPFFQHRFRCADGRYKTLRWTAHPDRESGLLYAVARDVTDIGKAEETYRIAIEASPSAMLMVDSKGAIRMANRAAGALLAFDPDELRGKTVESLLPVELHELHRGHRHEFLQEPVSRPMGQGRDLHAVRKDGTPVQVEIGLNPVELHGELALLIALADVTERKEARAQLERSRDDLLTVLDTMREGALIIDGAGQIIFANDTAARLLGVAPESGSIPSWVEVFNLSYDDRSLLKRMLEDPSGGSGRAKLQLVSPEGHRHILELEAREDPRVPRQRVIFLYDITEVTDLKHLLEGRTTFHDLVGQTEAMRLVFDQVRQVAPLDWTVLVQGETGTGKELAARAIHYQSGRKAGPFVPVNCAALSESLLTSQLFGHRRGAFTGAVSDQKGVFESASGGTIFLDEIGDMPLPLQTSLLRVLQEKEITRLGESQPRETDVRVIAATHSDLKEKMEEGKFRSDLFYRIQGFRITVPPLRDRRKDIPLLTQHFLQLASTASNMPAPEVTPEALGRLMDYSWPGNVRELRSALEWAAVRCTGCVRVEDLPPEIAAPSAAVDHTAPPPEDEKSTILRAIREADGNRSEAARRLGISRATFYRRLADLGIPSKDG